jgi:polyhydroxybutyrate depolymerase
MRSLLRGDSGSLHLIALAAATCLMACAQGSINSPSGTAGSGAAGSGSGGAAAGTTGGGAAGAAGSGTAGHAAGAGGMSDAGASDAVSTSDGGDASASTDGPAAAIRSAGCGKPAGQALASYVRKTVTSSTRVYDLYIPTGYNPDRAYRTIFVGHGCDGSIPYAMQEVTKGDAIIIALRAKDSQNSGQLYGGGCFDTMSKSSPEMPYFDAVLDDVASNYCVDKARLFITGHSSGAWLAYLLGCARAGVLRAQANTAGGLPPNLPTCTGPIAEMGMHDTTDELNAYSGGEDARNRILAVNGCGTETVPYDWDGDPRTATPCVSYQGCKAGFPVVWCKTTGKGHSDQKPMSTVGLWKFWSQF